MAKVRKTDSMSWANMETIIRDKLGITAPDYELELQGLHDAALRTADRYMNNPFTDSLGVDIDPLPVSVTTGVLAWMQSALTYETVSPGTASLKTGDLGQNWAGGYDPEQADMKAAKKFWINFRQKLWA